jgi:hypothetical protein
MAHSSRVRDLKRSKSGSATNILGAHNGAQQEDEIQKNESNKDEEDLSKYGVTELREKLKVKMCSALWFFSVCAFLVRKERSSLSHCSIYA